LSLKCWANIMTKLLSGMYHISCCFQKRQKMSMQICIIILGPKLGGRLFCTQPGWWFVTFLFVMEEMVSYFVGDTQIKGNKYLFSSLLVLVSQELMLQFYLLMLCEWYL
jgi:hypothetical protein